jgi:hypothetical protein
MAMWWYGAKRQNMDVEIRGNCISACTLVLHYIDHEKLCFGRDAQLWFHQARRQMPVETGDWAPSPESSLKMYDGYPEIIQAWIDAKGGLPWDGYLKLRGRELWMMGYRKCED